MNRKEQGSTTKSMWMARVQEEGGGGVEAKKAKKKGGRAQKRKFVR